MMHFPEKIMKKTITVITCVTFALGLTNVMNAAVNRGSISRGGVSSRGGHSVLPSHNQNFNTSQPFSIGYSWEHSNERYSISHEGSTSSQPGASFHEGTTTITTEKGSVTHEATSSKNEGSMAQHQATTKVASEDGAFFVSHHANTSILTQTDGSKQFSHSGETQHDDHGATIASHSGTTTVDPMNGTKEHDGETKVFPSTAPDTL